MKSKYIDYTFESNKITLSAILYNLRKHIRFFQDRCYIGENMKVTILEFFYTYSDPFNFIDGEDGQSFLIYVNHFQNEHNYLIREEFGEDFYKLEVISNIYPSKSISIDSYVHKDITCWLVQIVQELENLNLPK